MIDVRMDFNCEGGDPVLVGLHVQGFGWVLGGAEPGSVTVEGSLPLEAENVVRFKSQSQVDRLRNAIKNFDWYKRGGRLFKVKGR